MEVEAPAWPQRERCGPGNSFDQREGQEMHRDFAPAFFLISREVFGLAALRLPLPLPFPGEDASKAASTTDLAGPPRERACLALQSGFYSLFAARSCGSPPAPVSPENYFLLGSLYLDTTPFSRRLIPRPPFRTEIVCLCCPKGGRSQPGVV